MPAAAQTPDAVVMYRPPQVDPAPRRVGGNARGLPESMPAIAVLAPDHLALTLADRPTLLWHLAAPTSAAIEIVLVDPRRSTPLVETRVRGDRAGIHAFTVDGVRLEPDIAYEWSVAVITDPAQRSRDVVAGAAIMRVETPSALAAALASAPPERRPALLAQAGIWYDALAALSREIDARPQDTALEAQRKAILGAAGLALDRRP